MKKTSLIFAILGFVLLGYFLLRPNIHFMLYTNVIKNAPQYELYKDSLRKAYFKAWQEPNNPEVLLDLADKQVIMQDYSSAENNLNKALELKPELFLAREKLVEVLAKRKAFTDAENQAQFFIKIDPSNSKAYLTMANLYANFYTDKREKLPELYINAYKATQDPQFLLLLAGFYEQAGRFAEAVPLVETWLGLPQNKTATGYEITQKYLESLKNKQNLSR